MSRNVSSLLGLLLCSGAAIGGGFGFEPPVTIGQVHAASTVATDVNGDGRIDIVTLGVGPSEALNRKLAIYLQREDGTFAAPAIHDFGWQEFALNGPYLAVADMDADADIDVVVSTGDDGGRISILRNEGSSFSRSSIAGVGEISDLDLTDVNGDGYPDIVALAVFVDSAAIYYGNGNGGVWAEKTLRSASDSRATSCASASSIAGTSRARSHGSTSTSGRATAGCSQARCHPVAGNTRSRMTG